MKVKSRYKCDGVDMDSLKNSSLTVHEYFDLRLGTRRRLSEVFYGVRVLPYRFFAGEVKDLIRDHLAVPKYRAFLSKLKRCGYLQKDVEPSGRTKWEKTELTRDLNDRELADDIVSKKFIIRPEKPKTRKRSKEPSQGRLDGITDLALEPNA